MKIITFVTAATAPRLREKAVLDALNPPGYDRLRATLFEALIEAGIELDPFNLPSNWLDLHSLRRRCEVNAHGLAAKGQSQLQVGFNWPIVDTVPAAAHTAANSPGEVQVWVRFAAMFAGHQAPDVDRASTWAGQAQQLVRQLAPLVAWRAPRIELTLNAVATGVQTNAASYTVSHEGELGLERIAPLNSAGSTTVGQRLPALARQLKVCWPAWDDALNLLAGQDSGGGSGQRVSSNSIEVPAAALVG